MTMTPLLPDQTEPTLPSLTAASNSGEAVRP